jgi:hypothetical protein
VKIELLNDSHDPECIAFLDQLGESNPSILGYHYPIYRDMFCHIGVGTPFYWGARVGSQLVGLLPGFLRKADCGLSYCSLPFFGPNAGVICASDEGSGRIHSALLAAVLDYMGSQPDALTASFYTPFLFDRYEFYAELMPKAIVVQKRTQYLRLQNSTSGSKIRYDVSKAERQGVTVSTELSVERIETLYEIYGQNCLDYGIPLKPKAAIEFLLTRGIQSGRVRCYLSFHEAALVAGLVIILGPRTVSYYLPCASVRGRSLQAGTLLIDWAMNEARRRGFQFWNWESSPSRDSGVYRFKSKWGSLEGKYRIYIRSFASIEKLREIGAAGLSVHFPFFFVYPFDQM